MTRIIADLDAENTSPKTALLCTHAASLIAIGRVLTGRMPDDVNEEDFKPFTCGLSKFVRRSVPPKIEGTNVERWDSATGGPVPKIDWRNGRGVAGGWDCVLNGDCSFLDGGEERGWYVFFSISSTLSMHSLTYVPLSQSSRNFSESEYTE